MSAYPPPPPRRKAYAPDESPLDDAATLYANSPYAQADAHRRERQAKAEERRRAYGERHPLFFGTARKIRNPNVLTLVIILLGLAYVFLPLSSIRGLWPTRGPVPSRATNLPDTIPAFSRSSIMPAQKTFTLSSRTKGCHLVQSEVEGEIRDLLRGVKAGILTLFIQHTSAALSLNENFDRDVRTDMDMVRATAHTGARPRYSRIAPVAPHGRGPGRLGLALEGVHHRTLDHDPHHRRPPEPRDVAGHCTCDG